MAAPKKAARPSDFMPSRFDQKEKSTSKRINRKQVAEDVRAFFQAAMKAQGAVNG
jgi:hypothetical protein